MNYLDLFSGIGGFHLGLQRAGFKFDNVYYSEVDKYAQQIYKKQFPGATAVGDVSRVNGAELGKINLITFGFPCQDLSIAGNRAGLKGGRSGLFFEAIRIIQETRPDVFIFENVKGLFSSNNGKDFEVVLRTIADLGIYESEWQLLNTSWFLPQNRERVYFIGHLAGAEGSGRKVFPIREGNEKLNNESGKPAEGQIASCLQSPGNACGNYKGMNCVQTPNRSTAVSLQARDHKGLHSRQENNLIQIGTIGKDSEATRVYDPDGISRTIKNGGGMGAKTGLYEVCPVLTPGRKEKRQNGRRFKEDGDDSFTLTGQDQHGIMIREATKKGYAIAEEGDRINIGMPDSETRRGRVGKGIVNTLDTGSQMATIQNSNIRRLTPTECCRLQGFPDDWVDGISDTQKYKCLGNAVTVDVVRAIGERLKTERVE